MRKVENKMKHQSEKKKLKLLPIAAAVVAVAAAASVLVPRLIKSGETDSAKPNAAQSQSEAPLLFTGDVVIDESALSETATFYDYDANGTVVELFAVKASDGTARLALNTCQVCNGSPYAYFIQQDNVFICQNCKNAFARDKIGLERGGCNPAPITQTDYQVEDGNIIISAEFLEQYAQNFKNWKKF